MLNFYQIAGGKVDTQQGRRSQIKGAKNGDPCRGLFTKKKRDKKNTPHKKKKTKRKKRKKENQTKGRDNNGGEEKKESNCE